MSNPETPGGKARKARQRKPKTIEGKARDVTPKTSATEPSAKTGAIDSGKGEKPSAASDAPSAKPADAAKETASPAAGGPAAASAKDKPSSPAAKPANATTSRAKPQSSSPGLALPLLASGLAGGIAVVLILWGAGQLPPPGAPSADTAAIEDRLAALEDQSQNRPPAEAGGVSEVNYQETVNRLEGEIEALRQALASQPSPAEGAADAAAISQIEERIASLEEEVNGAQGSRDALTQNVNELQTRIGTMAETLSTLQARVTDLAEAQQARETSAQLRAAAALPVLGSLAEAVAAGRPTASYRDTLLALGIGRAQGAGVEDVPSNAEIDRLFDAARAALPAAQGEAAPASGGNGGVLSQLQSSLSGLVTVRRTDATEGPSPLDPVAEAIAAGDFAEARERLVAVNGEGEAVAALKAALQTRAAFEAAIADETARLANLLSGEN